MGRCAVASLLVVLVPAIVSARPVARGFAQTTVVEGLSEPTAAAFAPDGRLFVLEKSGNVRTWTAAEGLAEAPVATLAVCTDSEMGLLGLAFDPAFAANGFLYLYETHPPGGDVARCAEGQSGGRRNRVVRVTVAGAAMVPGSLAVLVDDLRTDGGNHDGGQLRIGPDGYLYVGVGDTGEGDGGKPGQATNPYAQDPTSANGKILRVAFDGSPAPDNPFAGRGGASDFVWAIGLRNPWRFAFEPATGLLWAGDVGQDTWEEIDVVRAGDDLGWPRCEGRAPRKRCPGGSVAPVWVYHHPPEGQGDASVTGGVFGEGGALGSMLAGSYLFGDYEKNVIWWAPVRTTHDGFARRPRALVKGAAGPVDLTIGPDGALWYVAFGAGAVRRVAAE
ncbi:MAG: PQQ-dependent sugar dehydrogenase [Candidatus Binatia bacterium]